MGEKEVAYNRDLTEKEKNMSMEEIFKQLPGDNITLTLGGLQEGDEVFFTYRTQGAVKINIKKKKDGRVYTLTPENQKQKLGDLYRDHEKNIDKHHTQDDIFKDNSSEKL